MLLVYKHQFFGFYMNSKGENPKRRRRMKNDKEPNNMQSKSTSPVAKDKKGENPKRRKIVKKTANSGSKVLKCILHCLKYNRFQNVLSWVEEKGGVFKVKCYHMHNPKWTHSMLSPFKAIEKIISPERYKRYSQSAKHSEECKTRFRSSLQKLLYSGVLKSVKPKEISCSDGSKERIYEIVNYSEELASDLLKDSEIGDRIENMCKMDADTREEQIKVDSQVSMIAPVEISSKEISHYLCLSNQVVPQRFGDTSSNDLAFPQANESLIVDPNLIQMQTYSELIGEPTSNMLSGSFIVDPNLIQRQTDSENIVEPTFNMLNTANIPALDNVQMENNVDFLDDQNPGILKWPSQNDSLRFNESGYASFYSPEQNNVQGFWNAQDIHYDGYSLPKHENSYNLNNLDNAAYNQDSMSSIVTPKNPFLSSTIDMYSQKAYECPDMWSL